MLLLGLRSGIAVLLWCFFCESTGINFSSHCDHDLMDTGDRVGVISLAGGNWYANSCAMVGILIW